MTSLLRSQGSWSSSPIRALTLLCLVVVSMLLSLVVALPAAATAPGFNGSIAFKGYLDADRSTAAIFTMGPDGRHVRQVTFPESGTIDDQPDWAPDGSLIAFNRCVPDTVCAIYTVRPDGAGLRRLTAPCDAAPADLGQCADEGDVAFMPDSKRVVFTRSTGSVREFPGGDGYIEHSDLVIRDLDGRHTQVVLRSKPFAGDINEAVVSPDGTQIAFRRGNSPLSKPTDGIAVFVVSIKSGHVTQVTPWSLNAADHPDWSPDGRWILFRSNESGGFLNSQLYVIHPDGTGIRQVTHVSADTTLLSSSFSPDGTHIVYARGGVAGQPDIFTARVDGSHAVALTRTPLWNSAPDWGPRPCPPRHG